MLQQQEILICEPGASLWIERWFHDCVYGPWEILAFLIGLSSVFFWLVAQGPQFMTNILRESVDALSPWFLMQWLAGDTFNLLGCLLTGDQLATQTVTASYFIFADCAILSQYIYYQIRNRNKIPCLYSDDSFKKPRFEYQNEVKKNADPVAKAQLFDEETKLQNGTAKVFNKLVCCGRHSQNIIPCHHNENVPKNLADKDVCHSGVQNFTPSDSPNLAHRCQNDSAKRQSKHATIFNKRSQIQTANTKHFLPSQNISNQQHTLICEECCTLRRVILEYGLECGQLAVPRHIGEHSLRINDVCANAKQGCRKLQVSVRKAKLRAVLCFTGLIFLGSSSWNFLLAPHSRDFDDGHGFLLGRKALKSFEEDRKKLSILRPNFPLLERPLNGSKPGRRILSMDNPSLWWGKELGRLLGWISSLLYLGSRISQLIKNKERRSADGLSLGMITCAMLANFTYGVSILMRASSWGELVGKAPWLVGSLGTVTLDLSLLIQAKYLKWHCKKGEISEHTPLLA